MLRQLLTLLALISGLAATGAPAQAHVADVENVRLVASAELASKCAAPVSGIALTARPQAMERAQAPCFTLRPAVVLAPVIPGVDRAHE